MRTDIGEVLVVEDDQSLCRTLVRIAAGVGLRVRMESSVPIAMQALSAHHYAVIVDLQLPDGCGFRVAELAMSLRVPCLILTGSNATEDINYAQCIGVEYACKPADRQNIERFLARAKREPTHKFDSLVGNVAMRHGLTPAQSRLIDAAMESSSHEMLAERLGISTNTIKTHIRGILTRTGATSLEELVSELRAAALRR